MYPEDRKSYNVNYTFHIQSAEDFYNALRKYNILDLEIEKEIEADNVDLAQDMLKSIGIKV